MDISKLKKPTYPLRVKIISSLQLMSLRVKICTYILNSKLIANILVFENVFSI